MIKWTLTNGILLQALTSGLWALGFGGQMTAFSSGKGVLLGQVIFCIHNLFYLPIFLLEYYGFHVGGRGLLKKETFSETLTTGTIGPFPNWASLIWCLLIGFGIYLVVSKLKEKGVMRSGCPSESNGPRSVSLE